MTSWTRLRIKWEAWRESPVFWLAIVAVIALLAFAFCRPTPEPIPPKEQKTLDSLDATKPAFDSAQHGTQRAVTNVITKIVRDSAAIARLKADADRAHARADSLAALAARSADSAAAWHAAYDARTAEAAQLRVALDTTTRDLAAAKDTLGRAKIQIAADAGRIAAHVNLEHRLASDLAAASPPCRVAYVLRCPSRKVAFVSGVVVASAGAFALTHRSQLKGVLP